MQSSVVSRLMVVSAALLFSTGGAAIKATTLGGWSTAGFRSLVACLVLVALVPESRRGWSWRILPGGLVYALTLVTFVLANKLTTSANAIYLQSTAPLYLLALGPLVLKEPLRRRDLLFGLVLLAAMGLFFAGTDNPVATAPNPARGNLFAVGLRAALRCHAGTPALAVAPARCRLQPAGHGRRRQPDCLLHHAAGQLAAGCHWRRRRRGAALSGRVPDRPGLLAADARHAPRAGL